MKKSSESLIADFGLDLEELVSSLTLLKYALENENEIINPKDIDNFLEIIIEKLKTVIHTYKSIYEKI